MPELIIEPYSKAWWILFHDKPGNFHLNDRCLQNEKRPPGLSLSLALSDACHQRFSRGQALFFFSAGHFPLHKLFPSSVNTYLKRVNVMHERGSSAVRLSYVWWDFRSGILHRSDSPSMQRYIKKAVTIVNSAENKHVLPLPIEHCSHSLPWANEPVCVLCYIWLWVHIL